MLTPNLSLKSILPITKSSEQFWKLRGKSMCSELSSLKSDACFFDWCAGIPDKPMDELHKCYTYHLNLKNNKVNFEERNLDHRLI
jgi:hypothetical protein